MEFQTLVSRTWTTFTPALIASVLLALLAPGALGSDTATAKPSPKPKRQASLSLASISSRPQHVTGGDSLVAVDVPAGNPISRVRVRRNGVDVTSAFSPSAPDSRRLVGLVTGLRNGDNRISARVVARNAAFPAELTLYNSSIMGPVFSGPRQTPFICTTAAAALGDPTGADCSAPTTVTYEYRTTGGAFKPLADPSVRPADLAQTTTRTGETIDYVVRIESGVIDRSIYRWAILAPGGQTAKGWNGRFFYTFGGGCSAGHQQGAMPLGAVLEDAELSSGYAVITSSLNRFKTACNDVLSAEAASMVKEHVVERLGRAPVWTIGQGGSGGSIQIQMIAQNYPGLLDGLLPSASFPDNSLSNTPDCRLLQNYFTSAPGSSLTGSQRTAISGLEDPNGCAAIGSQADLINASKGCDTSVVPASLIFNPVTNPDGMRCSIFDSLINIYGRDPGTGLVRRSDDNTGVQYGLRALQTGKITAQEFLDLNQAIGGFDQNGEVMHQRSVANDEGVKIAYRTGRINQGAGGYPDLPVIDTRAYVDTGLNVHQYIYTYEMRARLQRTNGTSANQVMFRAQGGANVKPMKAEALSLMGTWLDAIEADRSNRSKAKKVIADKPATAVDACWVGGGTRVNDPAVIGSGGLCETTYPPHSLPRLEAGQPLGAPILKCQLRPVNPADLGALSPSQSTQLAAAFPNGVCDYSKAGVDQQLITGTGQEFGPPRSIRQRHRSLRISARTHRSGRRTAVRLTARLGPCPATTWQRIVIQRLRGGRWVPVAVRIAGGHRCTTTVAVRIARPVRFRALSRFSSGYASAVSKPRTVSPRRFRHR